MIFNKIADEKSKQQEKVQIQTQNNKICEREFGAEKKKTIWKTAKLIMKSNNLRLLFEFFFNESIWNAGFDNFLFLPASLISPQIN